MQQSEGSYVSLRGGVLNRAPKGGFAECVALGEE